jgi:filamentous hemagglutinin family protein
MNLLLVPKLRGVVRGLLVLLACHSMLSTARANPVGPAVTQGVASFASQGAQFTITTSDRASINWQSFNIGLGETTTFVQPSSSSVVWNHINDPNPSQILGRLDANGYVILQNPSGFFIGGQAAISVGGLTLTTAPTPPPDLAGSGSWTFNAPPPSAAIINYGRIDIGNGGSAFLIAQDIENHGSIAAPGGNIGLYAGQTVLVSERPDGRGLSAEVKLPAGSVDNSGRLIADAGTIALNAQVVNQNGLVQANSVREVNGTIELVASESLNLGVGSVTQARGGQDGVSPGGSILLKSGSSYQGNAAATIDVSGGAQGGNGGSVEISSPSLDGGVQSRLFGSAVGGWKGGSVTLDPDYVTLVSGSSSSGSGSTSGDPLLLGVGSFAGFSQISVVAGQDIELSTLWNLPNATTPSTLSLTAGNNITFDDGTGINAGRNWSVNLFAGPMNLTTRPAAGTDGIYLNGGSVGGSFIQTQNGNISLWAANEVQIQASQDFGSSTLLGNGVRTLAGGNIQVTTQFGDVNTGGNSFGYVFQAAAPYYTVSRSVGGISTAAGGNVTINAGGDVRSYLPTSYTADQGEDAGTGAFGPQPGNVSINAGGTVYGHYVLANGTGTITAQNNVGGPNFTDNLALSLITGNWTVNAPNGNIYLQEVRNPNGVFNEAGSARSPGNNLFDYDPKASVTLNAGNAVDLIADPNYLPRLNNAPVPVLFPPSLYINAGAGGVYLDNQVTLFPSAYGELQITTTGGGNLTANQAELLMSDSGGKKWSLNPLLGNTFDDTDHGPVSLELSDPNPVVLNISGSIENLALVTSKKTDINVGGDLVNSYFSGQNLNTGDKTVINVAGQIFNSPAYSSVTLPQAPTMLPVQDLPTGFVNRFDSLLDLAVDPAGVAAEVVPAGTPRSLVTAYWTPHLLLGDASNLSQGTGFAYDATTHRLSFLGQMNQQLLDILNQPTITVVRFANDGYPMVDATGHFVTDTYTWVNAGVLSTLIAASANTSSTINGGLRIGGPGQFDIHAGSISLGNSFGILSCGVLDYAAGGGLDRYANLAKLTPVGADVNVTVDGNLEMLTSTIASLGGGNVNIKSTGGEIDLGTADVLFGGRDLPLGAFVTGPGNISVSGYGNVNIDGSRVAAYDGGSVTVNSETGNVDAGSGGATAALVQVNYVDPVTMTAKEYTAGVYGSGILATTLVNPKAVPGAPSLPGDILVTTPQGNIYASLGGILQEALNGNVSGGPTVTLIAGTKGTPGYAGNINLGDSGVIGGTINLQANGNINGLIISRQSTTVNAAQNFSGVVISGGSAQVSAGQSISGTIFGVGAVSVNSSSDSVTAEVLGQNVSVGGNAAQSTLGASATGTSTAASGANQATAQAQANTSDQSGDDDLKKKGSAKSPIRLTRISRVTVLLP